MLRSQKIIIPSILLLLITGCTASPSPKPASQAAIPTPTPKPKPVALDPALDTSTWQTYTDTESGFNFKYPKNWNIVSGATRYTVCLSEHSASRSCAIGVSITKVADTKHPDTTVSNDDLIKAFEKKYASEFIKKGRLVVNDLHTATYSVPEQTDVFIDTATYDYVLHVASRDEQGIARTNYLDLTKILETMTSTVRVDTKP